MFSVLAFTTRPYESAETRHRILQFRELAAKEGIRIDHRSLMGLQFFRWQKQNVKPLLRLLLYCFNWALRVWQVLFVAPRYDAVWLAREMAPLGPPILEWLLVRRCKRIIYDVDDALHIPDKEGSRLIPRLLRDHTKFARMAKYYTTVVCGNKYLADFYSQSSRDVRIIPTVVEPTRYSSILRVPSERVRIGWIGTPLNRYHLDLLQPALSALARQRDFELVAVGLNQPLQWDLPNVKYLSWNLKDEFKFFGHFDIGVMPLEDSEFTQGKCAFKLIQYMAAGLPVIASPVGANREVVTHGWNGYLADTPEDWQAMLRLLIDDADLRRRMGENGRDLVRRSYSVTSAWPSYSAILTGAQREASVCTS